MNAVLTHLPQVAAFAVLAAVLASILQLWIRHQHPVRILVQTISAGSIIGIVALAGLLPASIWWGPWLLGLATAGGAVLGCRRALTVPAPEEPAPRQARHLRPPGRLNLAAESAVFLAVLAGALWAG